MLFRALTVDTMQATDKCSALQYGTETMYGLWTDIDPLVWGGSHDALAVIFLK